MNLEEVVIIKGLPSVFYSSICPVSLCLIIKQHFPHSVPLVKSNEGPEPTRPTSFTVHGWNMKEVRP